MSVRFLQKDYWYLLKFNFKLYCIKMNILRNRGKVIKLPMNIIIPTNLIGHAISNHLLIFVLWNLLHYQKMMISVFTLLLEIAVSKIKDLIQIHILKLKLGM